MTTSQIVFYILALVITACAVLAVTARRMLRAATYLLIVLIGTAGLYLLLNYHFLAAVQLSVYAGGILILFIFAILLTSARGDRAEPQDRKRIISALVAVVAGIVVTTAVTLKHNFLYGDNPTITGDFQIPMKEIGTALMGTGQFQYLLPFEVLGVLLLSCIIGGILIARKR
ncbi:MAG: NADH-quinone oxidoreductase subunit J [Rikenellaceae bacterium]|jgi:NADH-quinone oxidoreductase subunit J|nr:NADH-quinone oxidoreductase subunit J [Rikenellaceae bacterium]